MVQSAKEIGLAIPMSNNMVKGAIMTRVYLDESLRTKLFNLQQPLEICDETGKVVGLFAPMTSGPYPEPLLTEEELERREQEPDFSTEDVRAFLEKL
jgi:hypothetical protein